MVYQDFVELVRVRVSAALHHYYLVFPLRRRVWHIKKLTGREFAVEAEADLNLGAVLREECKVVVLALKRRFVELKTVDDNHTARVL